MAGHQAPSVGGRLQLVAKGIVVASFQAALFALALACFHQMLQAPRPNGGGLTAFGAAFVPLHP